MQTLINTREDLDAMAGTPEHVAFMALLAGTLWRLEKDDTAQAWVAIEDNSTIERFDFTRADFPGALPPALPEYVPVERTALERVGIEKANALAKLQELDAQRVRPLAEIMLAQVAGDPIPLYAKAKLADIEQQAIALREKLK